VWKVLKTESKKLRPQASVSFDSWKKGRGETKAKPPYGFCYFQGLVVQDPREYPTLLLVQNLVSRGMEVTAIMHELNKRGLKSRMGKEWSYNVVKSIVRRIKEGKTDSLKSECEVLGVKNSNSKKWEK